MPTSRTLFCFGVAVLLSAALAPAIIATDLPSGDTLTRLQAAYNTSNNAFDRYQAMALRADLDGYAQVASLFRSVARSEQILYTACGDAIKQVGATPQTTPEIPDIRSTKENLENSIQATDALDRDPSLLVYGKRAKTEGNPKVGKIFEWIKDAESANLRLFRGTVKNMEQMKVAGTGYFVCGLTGFVSTTLEQAHCIGGDWERVK